MSCSRVRRAGRVARAVKPNFHRKNIRTRGIIQYTIRMAGTIDFKDLAVISHTSVRRERLHLLLGPDRAPIALSNGASPDDDALPMCFTLVQPIRSGGHVRLQTTKPN